MDNNMETYNVFKKGPRKGQPKTIKDSVIRYLTENLKFVELPCRSGKYRQFNPPEGSAYNDPFFVGMKGAVRTGRCASKSISIKHNVHPAMKKWEKTL